MYQYIRYFFAFFIMLMLSACGGGGNQNGNTTLSNASGQSSSTKDEVNTITSDTGSTKRYPVAYRANGEWFAISKLDTKIVFWNTNGKVEHYLGSNNGLPKAMTFSDDDSTFAAVGSHRIKLWSIADGKFLHALPNDDHHIYDLSFSPDSQQLASANSNGTISLWDYKNAQIKHTLSEHKAAVYAIDYLANGINLASTGADGKVLLWNVQTGELLATLQAQGSPSYTLAISPDGLSLFTANEKGEIHQWSLADFQLQKTISAHNGPIYSLSVSSDGRWLASAGQDQDIHIWPLYSGNIQTNTPGKTLQDHTGSVYSLAFNPVMNELLSSGIDKQIRRWDVETGRLLHRYFYTPQQNEDSDGELSPPEVVSKDLAILVFKALKPIFDLTDLVEQPSKFSQQLAAGILSASAVPCDSGSFSFQFADSNQDKKYSAVNDSFSVQSNQCRSGSITSNGNYTLRITTVDNINDPKETNTQLTLDNASIVEGNNSDTFKGEANILDIDKTIQRITTLTTKNLQMSDKNGDRYQFSSLEATITDDHSTSGDQHLMLTGQVFISGSAEGEYQFTTLTPFILTTYEKYPYQGSMKIQAVSGKYYGLTSTAVVQNATTVEVGTDNNRDGIVDSSIVYSWSDLSAAFN